MINPKTKICLVGGGTGGSVAPLLALADYLKKEKKLTEANFYWIGSKTGLEKDMIAEKKLKYYRIHSGKLRRYFDWHNFTDPFFIIAGFFESLMILLFNRPKIIVSAGSFVAVPVAVAGWLLNIPVIVHQMDVRPGLANKIMAPFAKIVTVTFPKSLKDYGIKAKLIGNMVRQEIKNTSKLDKKALLQKYGLADSMPVVLVVGGGTGAQAVNDLISGALPLLEGKCQIIHQTGAGKGTAGDSKNYKRFDFLTSAKLAEFYALADLVVSRPGLGFITELAYLSKPSILIPMPNTHQEDNAKIFAEQNAALVLDQTDLTPEHLSASILELLRDEKMRCKYSGHINRTIKTDAEVELTQIINDIV